MGYSLFIKKIMSSFQLSSFVLMPLALGVALLTSACGVPVAVSAASYAADGGLLATSNKTSTDHIASVVTKKDCAIWRVFRGDCEPSQARGERRQHEHEAAGERGDGKAVEAVVAHLVRTIPSRGTPIR